jgi:HlyD family secretion protein
MGPTSRWNSKPTKLIAAAFACIMAVAFPSLLFRRHQSDDLQARGDQTTLVERKSFSRSMRLTGTTAAQRSFLVLAPKLEGAQLSSMVITKLLPAGTRVHKDDVLVEFDPQAQTKDYLDKESTYKTLAGQLAQKRADADIARAKDDTAMQQAGDELKRAELELGKNEIVSRIDAEKNREAVDEAQATLKQLRETYELKRQAAGADIRILEIQTERAREAMRYAQANASKMAIRSPMDGVVVLNTIWLGGRMGNVQQGDEVRPGVPFLQVVDPSQMEVRADINQVEFPLVHPGQHAVVHLDAYPGMTLPAVLEELAPLGHAGQFAEKIRRFRARFTIQGNDGRLLPDLSVALDLQLGTKENTLVVSRQSVAAGAGKEFVWVRNSGGFEKRTIRTGLRNDLEVEVESGLAAGDVIRRQAAEN